MNIKSAWLTTTRSCNCRCNWCYAKETLGWKSFMDFDKAILAVDELKRKGVSKIVLIGGGPTIYNRFLDLIKYIHKSGINCTIATNGIKFKDINFAKATVIGFWLHEYERWKSGKNNPMLYEYGDVLVEQGKNYEFLHYYSHNEMY